MFNRVTERGDCSLACRFTVEITILAQRFQGKSGGKALRRMTMRVRKPATYNFDNAILTRKSQPDEGAALYGSIPGGALQQSFQEFDVARSTGFAQGLRRSRLYKIADIPLLQ